MLRIVSFNSLFDFTRFCPREISFFSVLVSRFYSTCMQWPRAPEIHHILRCTLKKRWETKYSFVSRNYLSSIYMNTPRRNGGASDFSQFTIEIIFSSLIHRNKIIKLVAFFLILHLNEWNLFLDSIFNCEYFRIKQLVLKNSLKNWNFIEWRALTSTHITRVLINKIKSVVIDLKLEI